MYHYTKLLSQTSLHNRSQIENLVIGYVPKRWMPKHTQLLFLMPNLTGALSVYVD